LSNLAPGDLALVAFGHNGQRGGEGAFIDFRCFVTQRQRPKPVGDEVMNFEGVGERGFQLARIRACLSGLAYQGLLIRACLSVLVYR
jgi:hypothetical protein